MNIIPHPDSREAPRVSASIVGHNHTLAEVWLIVSRRPSRPKTNTKRSDGEAREDEVVGSSGPWKAWMGYKSVRVRSRDEWVMQAAIGPLLVCGGLGGGHMRARAVCVHAALKVAAHLLLKHEAAGDRTSAIDVSIETSVIYVKRV